MGAGTGPGTRSLLDAGGVRPDHFQATAPDDDDGPTSGDAITVIVTSDEYLAEPPGQPIAGATVLIGSDGAVERMVTDDAGTARFAAARVTSYHVVYQARSTIAMSTCAPIAHDRARDTIVASSRRP
jgi:hypothetical protein